MKPKRRSSTTPVREQWRKEQDACMLPGCKASQRHGDTMEIHEIVGGADRAKALHLPALWLYLCHADHERFPSRPNQEQLVQELAIKLWADAENYDLNAVMRLWRPNCTLAFVEEIRLAVKDEYLRIVRDYT